MYQGRAGNAVNKEFNIIQINLSNLISPKTRPRCTNDEEIK